MKLLYVSGNYICPAVFIVT